MDTTELCGVGWKCLIEWDTLKREEEERRKPLLACGDAELRGC